MLDELLTEIFCNISEIGMSDDRVIDKHAWRKWQWPVCSDTSFV